MTNNRHDITEIVKYHNSNLMTNNVADITEIELNTITLTLMTNNPHDITEIVKHHNSNLMTNNCHDITEIVNYFSYIVAVICH